MIRRKWLAWRAMPPEQKQLAVSAWWRLAATRVALRVAGYRTVESWLIRTPSHSRFPGDYQLVSAVDVACRHQPGSVTCLPRALVLHSLCRSCGVPSVVRFGVRTLDDGLIEAHAWVEAHGRPVGDDGATAVGRYAVLEPAGLGVPSATTSTET